MEDACDGLSGTPTCDQLEQTECEEEMAAGQLASFWEAEQAEFEAARVNRKNYCKNHCSITD